MHPTGEMIKINKKIQFPEYLCLKNFVKFFPF